MTSDSDSFDKNSSSSISNINRSRSDINYVKPVKDESENTEVWHGQDMAMGGLLRTMSRVKSAADIVGDSLSPSFSMGVEQIRSGYDDFKRRNVKIRFITEITKDNLSYCKELMHYVELRHMEAVRGNMAVSETEYVATANLDGEAKPIIQTIYSNVKAIVEQHKYFFDNLWKKATPAEQRIMEIEQGLLPVETKVFDSPEEIYKLIEDIIDNSTNGLSNCSTIGGFQMIYEDKKLFHSYSKLLSKYKEGKVKGGVRWITYIEDKNEHVDIINKFLNIGIEIKHTSSLPPMNFALSDKQFHGTIEKMDNGKMSKNILYSTEPLYIKHFKTIFEELWKEGISAQQRIRHIKTGIAAVTTKVIENPIQSKNIFLQIIEEAQEEIMVIFPSLNSIKRQSKIGLFNLLKLKNQQNFRIRILSPMIDIVKEILLLEYSKESNNRIDNIVVREIPRQQTIRSTILMVDKKQMLSIEVKDDNKETFEEAIGLVTYSTSHPTLVSYVSIFETLWIQTEMFENIRIANEKLIESEELEREFINTAAHELRTPTQAIMGYTELDKEIFDDLLKNPKIMSDEESRRIIQHLLKHFDAISRNASRLDDLISNLLDVARIESNRNNSLMLHKEKLDLVNEIDESIKTQLDQKIKNKKIKVNIINQTLKGQCWVFADRTRLNQIINNLINNAIKFSPVNGIIDIVIRNNDHHYYKEDSKEIDREIRGSNKSEILVGISDVGKGISPQIIPRLFHKFITDSDAGTGLGLYITRKLVEAHGGNIWAFNNKDRVGSTFVFSLPKVDNDILDKK